MYKSLGYSVDLQNEESSGVLPDLSGDTPVFLSLHIPEQYDSGFAGRAERLCRKLNEKGALILADVSNETPFMFNCRDLVELKEKLGLWGVRVDFGFSLEEIESVARKIPVCLNASTTGSEEAQRIVEHGVHVMAMHNFYPRPETGLNEIDLLERTRKLQALGLSVLAFIPGDVQLRGPLHEGLPTLEKHRGMRPYTAFAQLVLHYGVDQVYVGDPGLSKREQDRIQEFVKTEVLRIPAELKPGYEGLYEQLFHDRVDAPHSLVRFEESRFKPWQSEEMKKPVGCQQRRRGAITADNELYLRYCGELQMTLIDRPADERVNVIGQVLDLDLLDLVQPGRAFCLVRAE